MTCYDCDGRGWLALDEFREFTDRDGLLGDDHELVIGTKGIYLSICPDCDGKGKE